MGRELRAAEGAAGGRREGRSQPPPRRCDRRRPPPPPSADMKDDRCRPRDCAAGLRAAPSSRRRRGGGCVGCSHRCQLSTSASATGAPRAPSPPAGVEAESSSTRAATRRGAGNGCREGGWRRRSGFDDDSDQRGLCDPTQESDPAAALGSRQPCEGHAHPSLTPMAVSRCSCSCPTFLVWPAAPVRLLLSAPPPLSNAPPLPAPPPRLACAEGMGTATARHRCGKLEGMGNEQLRGKRRGRRFLDRRLGSSSALCRSRAARAAPAPSPPPSLCPQRLANLNLDRIP